MRRYIALGSVRALQDALADEHIVTKLHKGRGGIPFTRGGLSHLLRNALYLGEVHFKGQIYPGQHQAIVDRALWDAVQRAFASSLADHKHGGRAQRPSLLSGIVFDPNGGRMTPSHAVKNGQRYRYYITLADHCGRGRPACRVAAQAFEDAVCERLAKWMLNERDLDRCIDAVLVREMMFRAEQDASTLRCGTPSDKRAIVLEHIQRVDVGEQSFTIALTSLNAPKLTSAFGHVRVGNEMKMLIRNSSNDQLIVRDEQLLQTIADARTAQQMALRHADKPLGDLAVLAGRSAGRFKHLLRLSYLAPGVVEAIIAGRAPAVLAGTSVHKLTGIPLTWAEQYKLFACH